MVVRYRNVKTESVATYSQPMPQLERSEDWERVEDKPADKPADKPEKKAK